MLYGLWFGGIEQRQCYWGCALRYMPWPRSCTCRCQQAPILVIHLSLSFVDVEIVTLMHDPIIIYPFLQIRASHHSKDTKSNIFTLFKYNLIRTQLWNLVKDPSVIVINLKLTFDCPAFSSCYSLRASICVVDCTSRPPTPRLTLSLIFLSLNPQNTPLFFFFFFFLYVCWVVQNYVINLPLSWVWDCNT
jgi:hypothetical protein